MARALETYRDPSDDYDGSQRFCDTRSCSVTFAENWPETRMRATSIAKSKTCGELRRGGDGVKKDRNSPIQTP